MNQQTFTYRVSPRLTARAVAPPSGRPPPPRPWWVYPALGAALLACAPAEVPQRAPIVARFAAASDVIDAGASTALAWIVVDADSLALEPGIGSVGPNGITVAPAETTTFTLVARRGALSSSASVTVTVLPAGTDALVRIDSSSNRRPISPYVYGYNAAQAGDAAPGASWLRLGGNRWTAYNWETNYSNAGADLGPYRSDAFFGSSFSGAAAPVLVALDSARRNGLAFLATVPIQGWVAKDGSGDVSLASPVTDHFLPTRARKNAPLVFAPDPTDGAVYEDEYANLVAARWGATQAPLGFSLDNEPDAWGFVAADGGHGTHPEVQRTPLTYADLLGRSVDYAGAVKDVAPQALVFGPVLSGWNGYTTLGGAPDAAALGDFLDHYLTQMSAASAAQGRRLLDVLDVHFYSEVLACGARINGVSGGGGDCVAAARVQAPRSLWDPTYVEASWITRDAVPGQPLDLIHRLTAKIDARYPGTLLSISEYDFGGADDPSGAVAQAEALGGLGRNGVYAAAFWPQLPDSSWARAAWLAFRDYDGAGSSFGDTGVDATSSDLDHVSPYSSVDAASANRLVAVLVHRPTLDASGKLDARPRTVTVLLTHPVALTHGRAWQLSPASVAQGVVRASRLPDLAVRGRAFTLTLPAMSVTTIELTP